MAYPTPFETVLRAEKAIGAHFETCRALQRTGVVLAFQPDTLPRCDCSHIEQQRTREWYRINLYPKRTIVAERETCEEQNPIPATNEARASRIELAFLVI